MQLEYLMKDPVGVEPQPESRSLVIPSAGFDMYGNIQLAAGPGPKPVMVILHGFPGFTQHTDIARALARAGMSAVTFHYRGAWGSKGEYLFSHLKTDVLAVLGYLRENAAQLDIDPKRMALLGHSMGGFAALNVMASRQHPAAAVVMAPYDLGMIAQEHPDELTELLSSGGCLASPGMTALREDAEAMAEGSSFLALASRLLDRKLLFVGGIGDECAPPSMHIEPVKKLLPKSDYVLLNDDHSFNRHRLELITLIAAWTAAAME